LVVQGVPQPPNLATGVITLHGHVKLIAIHIPVGVVFESLNTISVVCVNPEILLKMGDRAYQSGIGTVMPPEESISASASGINL
jgi:hypothetical protein